MTIKNNKERNNTENVPLPFSAAATRAFFEKGVF